jgi:FkbM family methyltransferase
MKEILCREITRRLPMELEHLPWILKFYKYPFDRWTTVGRQGLYGAPNLLTYLFYQKLWPGTIRGTFHFNINGQRKKMEFNSKNAVFCILYFNQYKLGYEPQISAVFDLLTPADGNFYDIGSNWGWFSLMAASNPGFTGQIHAFEPFPSTHQDLASIVQQAGLQDRIHLHDFALMAEAGTASIYLPDGIHSGNATVTKENRGATGIKTSRLDDFDGPPPGMMKVDVEGNEAQVFLGGQKTIARHQPVIVFENKRETDDLKVIMEPLMVLEKLGYVFYHAAWLRQVDGSPCLVGDEFDPFPQMKETLALVPFQSAQRLLLHTAMNIVAVHRDKVALVEAKFEKRKV